MPRERATCEVLFHRGSQDGDSTADDWDDTELLKEYDRAVRPLKALLAERMGLSNSEMEEASATESGSSRSVVDKEGFKSHKQNQKKRRKKGKNKHRREWAVGDHCQAMFTVDHKWYEATVLSIDLNQGTCTVQYVGYGNTEKQPLSSISHSMGAAARREQGRQASLDKAEAEIEAEANQSDDLTDHSTQASAAMSHLKVQSSDRRNKCNNSGKIGEGTGNHFSRTSHRTSCGPSNSGATRAQNIPGFPGLAGHTAIHDMVAPPLPPHILASLPSDDSEALSAMLMSWYMSGFHTGYYQGLKRAKNFSQSQ